MSKSPEEYFQDQEFQAEEPEGAEINEAERAFLEKYLGFDEEDILERLGVEAPTEVERAELPEELEEVLAPPALEEAAPEEAAPEEAAPEQEAAPVFRETVEAAPETAAEPEAEPDLEVSLRRAEELQLVSFFLREREFTVPIEAVQEVVRYVQPTAIPGAPEQLRGIVNLRGRVTPVLDMVKLLRIAKGEGQADEAAEDPEKSFIVVCKRKGLQIGLLISKVGTMYRVKGDQIEWNIDTRLGEDQALVTALLRLGEKLIGVVSVDRIVTRVTKR